MLSPYYKPKIDLLIEGRLEPQRGSFYFLQNVHDKTQDDTKDIFISLTKIYLIGVPVKQAKAYSLAFKLQHNPNGKFFHVLAEIHRAGHVSLRVDDFESMVTF
jgi:hypothetical protein